MFTFFPREDEKQILRLRRLMMACASYLMLFVVMFVAVWMDLLDYRATMHIVAAGALVNLVLYIVIRSGVNLRLKDPSLTALQVTMPILMVSYGMYFADSSRGVFLLAYLVAILFGLFRLNTRELLAIGMLALVSFGIVIGLSHYHKPEVTNLKDDLLNWIVLGAVLPWFAWLGGYLNHLRKAMRDQNLQLSEREATLSRFQLTLDQTLDCIFMFRTTDFRFIYVNQGAQRQVGYTEAELLAMSPLDLSPEYTLETFRQLTQPLTEDKQVSTTFEAIHHHKDGHEIPVEIVMQLIQQTGAERCFVAIVRDITERKQAEKHILRLAHYDELSGLANRSMFSQSLNHAHARARRNGKPLAILFIDLDRFKKINDTLGHAAGDKVLKEVADRLRACVRDSDTIGRLGGDEFVVLLEEMSQPAHGAVVAQKIIDSLAQPFILDAQEFHITASIGISTYPADSEDMPGLLKNADIAMYRAKDLGKNNYQFYSTQMNVHTLDRLTLESRLRRALERNEFVLHYQPKINVRSGRISGMEALVRWQHPTNGLIPPMQFIPLAEETGLIVAISQWVLKTACTQNKAWRDLGLPSLCVAVNLSARQFNQDRLLHDVETVLKDTGLDATGLELEITESMVMHDPERAVILLNKLRAMGISISIDDFGTGYSSLSYLKRFPIDSLKIDRSFIQGLPQDGDDAAIAQAIIAMAHSLKVNVIAEGVETDAQLRFLRDHLCDEVQGYYFSKPVPEQAFASLVLKNAAS